MPVRLLAASLLTAALALGASAEAAPLLGPTALPVSAEPSQVVRVDFGDRLNRARNRAGAGEVRSSRNLRRAARRHAADMTERRYFSHTAPDGSDPMDRAQRAECNCHAVAENIAMGQRSAGEVFRAWMNSPGHRDNMLRNDYDSYGLGRQGDTWVLVLSD